ncbi:hypothetical protein TNCV_3109801 [Trichonephila clavipes]|nr:hypothetical protein TNCV_3109801 [Trichonephila clavipes]
MYRPFKCSLRRIVVADIFLPIDAATIDVTGARLKGKIAQFCVRVKKRSEVRERETPRDLRHIRAKVGRFRRGNCIRDWVSELKRGCTSCQDEHRSSLPNEVTTSEMVKKINKAVLDDHRLKVRDLADIVGI